MNHGHLVLSEENLKDQLKNSSASETIANWKTRDDLPDNWDWRAHPIAGGKTRNWTTAVRNQHIP